MQWTHRDRRRSVSLGLAKRLCEALRATCDRIISADATWFLLSHHTSFHFHGRAARCPEAFGAVYFWTLLIKCAYCEDWTCIAKMANGRVQHEMSWSHDPHLNVISTRAHETRFQQCRVTDWWLALWWAWLTVQSNKGDKHLQTINNENSIKAQQSQCRLTNRIKHIKRVGNIATTLVRFCKELCLITKALRRNCTATVQNQSLYWHRAFKQWK